VFAVAASPKTCVCGGYDVVFLMLQDFVGLSAAPRRGGVLHSDGRKPCMGQAISGMLDATAWSPLTC
jgi:hypothetical protein